MITHDESENHYDASVDALAAQYRIKPTAATCASLAGIGDRLNQQHQPVGSLPPRQVPLAGRTSC
jgi:hypothetical protein